MAVDFGQRKTLQIRTPEGVVFRLAMAGLMTRTLALLIDFIMIITISEIISYAFEIVCMSLLAPFFAWVGDIGMDFIHAATTVIYFIVGFGYGIYAEWYFRGQTVGKYLFRLRVMDASGLRLQFSQIIIRNLLRPIDLMPFLYMVGGLTALYTRYGQRLGDLAANTVVVLIPTTFSVDLSSLQESRYNSLRDSPHLESRLRQKVSAQDAAIALEAVMRRDEMDPDSRVELFRQLATHFRAIVQMPEEANEVLTDEQYIRNLVASLYRQVGQVKEVEAPKAKARKPAEAPRAPSLIGRH